MRIPCLPPPREHAAAAGCCPQRWFFAHRTVDRPLTTIDNYKKAVDEGCVGKKTSASGYPENFQMLVDGEGGLPDPKHRKIYFLRWIPRDPMHRDASLSPTDSWAKRACACEPDNPREGYDFFVVHSKSRGIGLNGVSYGQW